MRVARAMQKIVLLAGLLLAGSHCFGGVLKPQRIVSLSLCTDQVLLMLVEPERIAAVSNLAADPVYSYMWQQATDIPAHAGLAEEIIPLQPDLIIGSIYSTGSTKQMLEHLGHPVISIGSPTTIEEVRTFTRQLGEAVGEPERAEQVITDMEHDIRRAEQLVAGKPEQLAISYGPNGFTAGTHTLKNEILAAAGYRNLASELGIDYYGNLSLEQLVIADPDAVIIDEAIPNQDSVTQSFVTHPVLQRLARGKEQPTMPSSYWLCPGPIAGAAILRLAEQRQ